MRVRTVIFGLVIAATTGGAAKEAVTIQVSPEMSFAPTNLVIQTRVEPDADNRAIEVTADSEEFYRSSTIQLEGDRAPKTTRVEFRSLPPGTYEVTAALIGADGRERGLAHASVTVIESSGSLQ